MVVLGGPGTHDQCGTLYSVRAKGPAVPFGSKVVQGPRELLEDAFSVASVPQPGTSPSSPGPSSAQSQGDSELSVFGVFDGHGGAEAAQHAASRLHLHFSDALAQESLSATVSTDSVCSQNSAAACADALLAQEWSGSSSGPPDSDVLESLPEVPPPGWAGAVRAMAPLNDRYSHSVRRALQSAFIRTDADLAGTEVGEVVGTTAVVAVVSKSEVFVAHCGDSRSVLCRKGVAVPLTDDHKPDRPDERERVSALGGKIIYKGGSHRVMGLLAMTRAIGDHLMRPYVIPDPEVMSLQRTYDDELLLLASDGLWDVFSNQEATTLALRSTMRARERGASASAACRIGASVLARGAMERGSKDNITVVVVDLRLRHHESPAGSVAAVLASQCSDAPYSTIPYSRRKRSSSGAEGGEDQAVNAECAGSAAAAGLGAGAAPGWCSSNGGLVRPQQQQQRAPGPHSPQRQSHMEAIVSTWAAAAAAFSSSGGSNSNGGSRSSSRSNGGIWPSSAVVTTDSSPHNHQQQRHQQLPSVSSLPVHHGVAAAAAAAASTAPRSAPGTAATTPRSSHSSQRSQSFTVSNLHTWRPHVLDPAGGGSSSSSSGSDAGGIIPQLSGSGAVLNLSPRPGVAAAATLDGFGSAVCGAEKPPLPRSAAQQR